MIGQQLLMKPRMRGMHFKYHLKLKIQTTEIEESCVPIHGSPSLLFALSLRNTRRYRLVFTLLGLFTQIANPFAHTHRPRRL